MEFPAYPAFLDIVTFGVTFTRQFAAAAIASRYFSSLFFQRYLCSHAEEAGFNGGAMGREEEEKGKDAGQIGFTVVFSRRSSEDSLP